MGQYHRVDYTYWLSPILILRKKKKKIVTSTSGKACIPKLDRIFATHGIPRKIKTDNGPPFNGDDFKRYTVALGIEWKTNTPLWTEGNENAERAF